MVFHVEIDCNSEEVCRCAYDQVSCLNLKLDFWGRKTKFYLSFFFFFGSFFCL